jgi:TolB protein
MAHGHRWVKGAGMKNANGAKHWIDWVWAPVVLALWLVLGCGGGQGDNAPNEEQSSTSPATTATIGSAPETTDDESPNTSDAAPRVTLQLSAPSRLTNDLDGYVPFSLSLEGDKVAFSNPRDDDIYVINSDGTNLTNVTEGAAALGSQPTFTPDGDEIIFPVDHNNSNTDIYVVSSDGTNLTNVTETKAAREEDPAVSPDGNQIVFVRDFDTPNPPPRSEVYVMDTDGTNQKRLTYDVGIKLQPAFSPDGEKVAFTRMNLRNPPAWPKVYVVNADGSDMHELIEGLPFMEQFTFSPDGENIAFTAPARTGFRRVSPEEVSDIYVANFDGSDLTRLTYKWGFDGEPAFVPGTDMVAFASDRDGDSDIYAIRLDGTGLTNLTDTDSADELAPTFSADGTKMAYTGEGIYVMKIVEKRTASDE